MKITRDDDDMRALQHALNQESLDWMSSQHPELVDAIEKAVKSGATPEQVRLAVIRHAGPWRQELAKRAELATLALMGEL